MVLEQDFQGFATNLSVQEEVFVVQEEEEGWRGWREVAQVAALDAEGAVASSVGEGEDEVVDLE
jgi:hypothetical protein